MTQVAPAWLILQCCLTNKGLTIIHYFDQMQFTHVRDTHIHTLTHAYFFLSVLFCLALQAPGIRTEVGKPFSHLTFKCMLIKSDQLGWKQYNLTHTYRNTRILSYIIIQRKAYSAAIQTAATIVKASLFMDQNPNHNLIRLETALFITTVLEHLPLSLPISITYALSSANCQFIPTSSCPRDSRRTPHMKHEELHGEQISI